MNRRLRQALSVLAVSAWKVAAIAQTASASTGREYAVGQEWSANTYVSLTRSDPVNITACGTGGSSGFVFHDLWLMNGNPGNGLPSSNWVEIGTSYCDQYKTSAHYVAARSQDLSYFEHSVSGYVPGEATFKITRQTTGYLYNAYVIPPGGSAIDAMLQVPSYNETSNYGGNWSQVGLEQSDRTGDVVPVATHQNLKYRTGPSGSITAWSGRDGCYGPYDAARGHWATDDAWKSERPNNTTVSGC